SRRLEALESLGGAHSGRGHPGRHGVAAREATRQGAPSRGARGRAAKRLTGCDTPSTCLAPGSTPPAILVPVVAHRALPAILWVCELVLLFRCCVAPPALLHALVQLTHCRADGILPLCRARFFRHIRGGQAIPLC